MKCPVCQGPLTGRSDKKYCSDQCRYMANNKNKNEAQQTLLDVNCILRRNRTILKKLCPVGKAVVRKEVMDVMGYDFQCFSSLFLTSGKQIYYICYDYAFLPILEHGVQKALIVTRQEYMGAWDPWKFVKRNPSQATTPSKE